MSLIKRRICDYNEDLQLLPEWSLLACSCAFEEIDDTDSDIQIEDPLFIRKLCFMPLLRCPCFPAQMLIP